MSEGGGSLFQRKGNDETVTPLGRMQCMARGVGLGVGIMGGVYLDSKSGAEFIFPRKRMGGISARESGSKPARRSPIQASSLFHEPSAISPLS